MAGSTVVVSVLADVRQLKSGLDSASGTLGKFGGAFAGAAKIATGAMVGIAGALAGLAAAGGFSRALKLDEAKTQLAALGYAGEQVDSIMSSALASVKGTAFGLDAAATIAAQALASGVPEGERLTAALTTVANTAALAKVDMADMGAIFSKVWANGRVTTMEMNQLADRGVPIWQYLSKAFGVTNTELRKMIEQGEVTADMFEGALGPAVEGMAGKMSNSFKGMLANTRAALSRLGAMFAAPILESGKTGLGVLTSVIDDIAVRLQPFADRFAAFLGTLNIAGVGDRLLASLDALAAFFSTGGGASILANGRDLFAMLQDAGRTLQGPLANGLRDVLDTLLPLVPALVAELTPALAELIPAVASLVVALLPLIPPIAELAAAVLPALAAVISDVAGALGDADGSGFVAWLAGFIGFLSTPTGDWLRDVAGWIASLGPLSAPLAALVSQFASLFDGARHGGDVIANLVDRITSLVSSIPGRIQSALAGVGEWLVDSGKALIQGFISGISSMLGAVGDAVGSVMSFVAGFFPSSPAKRGPFSGSGWTRLGRGGGSVVDAFLGGFQGAAAAIQPFMAGLASDVEGAFAVKLVMPQPDGGRAGAVSRNSGPTHVTNVSITQNNPLTRDPLKQLREQSEMVAAGIW